MSSLNAKDFAQRELYAERSRHVGKDWTAEQRYRFIAFGERPDKDMPAWFICLSLVIGVVCIAVLVIIQRL